MTFITDKKNSLLILELLPNWKFGHVVVRLRVCFNHIRPKAPKLNGVRTPYWDLNSNWLVEGYGVNDDWLRLGTDGIFTLACQTLVASVLRLLRRQGRILDSRRSGA